MTEAYFQNIRQQLLQILQKSEKKIAVAVAWFTDSQLFDILIEKALKGVEITIFLVKDDINCGVYGLPFEALQKIGGRVFWTNPKHKLMHHKFCIIDGKKIGFGSYNWTNKANNDNVENLLISDDTALIISFEAEFKRLFDLYNLKDIVISKEMTIGQSAIWLKIQIKILEEQNALLTTEINHWQMLLHQFDVALRSYVYATYVVLANLKIKMLEKKAKLTQKQEDVIAWEQQKINFENFEKGQKEEKIIRTENIETNKKLYREIVKLCHPDKVEEKYKTQANLIFDKAKNALDNQDNATLQKLLAELEQGIAFEIDIENPTNQNKLQALYEKLLQTYKQQTQTLQHIQQTKEYDKIQKYQKWEIYFEEVKENLLKEIASLKKNV